MHNSMRKHFEGILAPLEKEVVRVSPSEAKKAATGNGNAKKELVQAMISARFGIEATTDEADAIAIGLVALNGAGKSAGVVKKKPRPKKKILFSTPKSADNWLGNAWARGANQADFWKMPADGVYERKTRKKEKKTMDESIESIATFKGSGRLPKDKNSPPG